MTDDNTSTIQINSKGDNVYMLLQSDSLRFEIEPLTGGLHVLVEIDPTKFESELPPLEVPEDEREKELSDSTGKQKTPLLTAPQIDVLVAYTTSAKNATGDINQLISSAVGLSNFSFSNSNVNATLNVVHTVEVSYTESGNISTDLTRLRLANDSYMDNIHSLRNQYGADLVVLLVSSGGAGIAYVDATSSFAFSDVHYSYAQSQYSMTHEIGHNLGCAHNIEDANVWAYPYGFGYRSSGGGWRTLMAYSPPSNRINFWSNPDVYLSGIPMGTVQQEDNARVWDERAAAVASFRTSTSQFEFEISGGDYFNYGNFGIWSANVSSGASPYNFTWYRSYTSSSGPWTTVGNGTNYAQTVTHDMWLKLYGTDSNSNSHEDILKVNVLTCSSPPCPIPKIIGQEPEAVPDFFGLVQNYPNPFNPSTNIRFELPEASTVSINVFNLMGQQIATLVDQKMEAGSYTRNFEASNLSSGIYFARIKAVRASGEIFTKSIKMQLIK
ncbi:MAG: zinc-dependent metalloprotease [Balneolaceae bacterium]|nr:zinc-dependent metalloprotease [Balneolaceae bacterium]